MMIADPQFGIASFLLNKNNGRTTPNHVGESVAPPGTRADSWQFETDRLTRAIEIANSVKPEFIVVLGDMVMDWNHTGQRSDLLSAFERLSPDIPVRWVPGNHDVGVDYYTPTSESLEAYRSHFGPDRYAFTAGDYRYIVINTPLMDAPEEAASEADEQWDWLQSELAEAKTDSRRTVLFGHHPPFNQHLEEESGTFNLPIEARKRLVGMLNDAGVKHYFAGHTHANQVASDAGLRVVATSAVGVSRHGHFSGYRLAEMREDGVHHSFYPIT